MYIKEKPFKRSLRGRTPPISIQDLEIMDYFSFSMDYLKSSEVLFQEAKNEMQLKKPQDLILGLVIPANYNLRHSFELFIKSIKELVRSDFPAGTVSFKGIHSIKVLHMDLITAAKYLEANYEAEVSKTLSRYKHLNPTIYAELSIKSLQEIIMIFTQILDKYVDADDINNEQYRYPKTSRGKFYKFSFIY